MTVHHFDTHDWSPFVYYQTHERIISTCRKCGKTRIESTAFKSAEYLPKTKDLVHGRIRRGTTHQRAKRMSLVTRRNVERRKSKAGNAKSGERGCRAIRSLFKSTSRFDPEWGGDLKQLLSEICDFIACDTRCWDGDKKPSEAIVASWLTPRLP